MANSGDAIKVDTGEAKADRTGQAERLGLVEDQLSKVVLAVDTIVDKVDKLFSQMGEVRRNQLSTAVNPEVILDQTSDVVELRRQVGQAVDTSQFQVDDIVQIADGTEYAERVRVGLQLGPDDELPLGIVLNRLYKHKNGKWKYKVHFKILGRDGCLEDEIVLISRPKN